MLIVSQVGREWHYSEDPKLTEDHIIAFYKELYYDTRTNSSSNASMCDFIAKYIVVNGINC